MEKDNLDEAMEALRHSQGHQLPDLEAVRDRYLKSLKIGSQSPIYKAVKKALDQFISKLRNGQ